MFSRHIVKKDNRVLRQPLPIYEGLDYPNHGHPDSVMDRANATRLGEPTPLWP